MKEKKKTKNAGRQMRPALTPEARDSQLASLAVDLAEQQLRDGTASSQVITHYLKIASFREKQRLEVEKLEAENKLLMAKVEVLKSQKRVEELYENALNAMRAYNGQGDDDDY